MAEVVLALGGMIDKFQGDAVMACSARPSRRPTTRSARSCCAIAMQARQTELNAEGWGADVAARSASGSGSTPVP